MRKLLPFVVLAAAFYAKGQIQVWVVGLVNLAFALVVGGLVGAFASIRAPWSYMLGAAVVIVLLALGLLVSPWLITVAQARMGHPRWRDRQAQQKVTERFDIEFSPTSIGFLVNIRNRGETLNDAFINVVVPERVGNLRRIDSAGVALPIGVERKQVLQTENGERLHVWEERGLLIPGFKTNSPLWFAIDDTSSRESFPVIVRLGGAELGEWVSSTAQIVTGPLGLSGPNGTHSTRDEDHRTIAILKPYATEYSLAHVEYFPNDPRHRELAQKITALFELAGWETQHNDTPQELPHIPSPKGVEVRGVNSRLVGVVSDALEKAGVQEITKNVIENKIGRDNPKYAHVVETVYVIIGHLSL